MQQKTEQNLKKHLLDIEVKTLLDLTQHIKPFIREGRFKINKDGISFIEIDPSNVLMIESNIKKNLLINLYIEDEVLINLNIDNLYKALKENKKKIVKISMDSEKLYLNFSNGFKSELSLLERVEDTREIPSLSFESEITLKSKRFKEIVKNLNNVSDSLKIKLNNNCLSFISKGLNKSQIDLDSNEATFKGDSESNYSLDYLIKIVKSPIISEDINIKFSNTYPLKINLGGENFNINYILAPRVEDDY